MEITHDTIEDLLKEDRPEIGGEMEWLYNKVFSQIIEGPTYVGLALTGICEKHAAENYKVNARWGPPLHIGDDETIQFQCNPKLGWKEPLPLCGRVVTMLFRHSHGVLGVRITMLFVFDPAAFKFTPTGQVELTSEDKKACDTDGACTGTTVGCNQLHLLPVSLFSSHGMKGTCKEVDNMGYISLLPSVTLIREGDEQQVTDARSDTGYCCMKMAMESTGIVVCEKKNKNPWEKMATNSEWNSTSEALLLPLANIVGWEETNHHIMSMVSVLELVTTEGLMRIMQNSDVHKCLPDQLCKLWGTPMFIVMMCRISVFPERFGLSHATKQDDFANQEIRCAVEIDFEPYIDNHNGIERRGLAVDSILQLALGTAIKSIPKQEQYKIKDCLVLWRRIGQNLITRLFGVRCGGKDAEKTTLTKYNRLARDNVVLPISANSVHRFNASNGTMSTSMQLIRMHHMIERNFRNAIGMGQTDTEHIKTLAQGVLSETVHLISTAFTQGPRVLNAIGISTFCVGRGSVNNCASCNARIHVFDSICLYSKNAQCKSCYRPRCFECRKSATNCMQCNSL